MVIDEMLLARQGKQFVSSLKLNVNAFKKKIKNCDWDRFALLISSGDCNVILCGYRCLCSNVLSRS